MIHLLIKKISAVALLLCAAVSAPAFAEVLGTLSENWQTDMGGGAVYNHNVFYSDSVGNQTENYVEYKPNSEVVPIVVNGASVYGGLLYTSRCV